LCAELQRTKNAFWKPATPITISKNNLYMLEVSWKPANVNKCIDSTIRTFLYNNFRVSVETPYPKGIFKQIVTVPSSKDILGKLGKPIKQSQLESKLYWDGKAAGLMAFNGVTGFEDDIGRFEGESRLDLV
jgi:hypothetical protein